MGALRTPVTLSHTFNCTLIAGCAHISVNGSLFMAVV